MTNNEMALFASMVADEQDIRKAVRAELIDEWENLIISSCKDATCKEDITIDNDFDFYASELLEMLEMLKRKNANID